MVQNYRIDLGYDGTEFFGSQRQPGLRTVQAELEQALERLTGERVSVVFAGRTDRGVHAIGQVVSARLGWRQDPDRLRRGLAAVTPDDLAIYAVQVVDEDFHARYSAHAREYRYRIWQGQDAPVLLRRTVWHVRSTLDIAAMRAASEALIGRHDFASFAGSGAGTPGSNIDCVRTVMAADLNECDRSIESRGLTSAILEFRIRGNGFLPQMVRNIVGDLVAVGRREKSPEWLRELVDARDRRLGAPPAPPSGLVLWNVEYDHD